MHGYFAVIGLWLLSSAALGQTSWATFTFQPPLTQVNGVPISEAPILGYRLLWGTTPTLLTNEVRFPGNTTEFKIEMLPNSPAVYAVMHASNEDGEGPRSNVACFTFTGPACLPGPFETDVTNVVFQDASPIPTFTSLDIGSPGVAGSYSLSGGTHTVKGAGTDIWGTSDEFQFAYVPLTGDGEMIARVESVVRTNFWAKAGLMVRSSLSPSSSHGLILLGGAGGVVFQSRPTDGSVMSSQAVVSPLPPAPQWFKIERAGSVVRGFRSVDGTTWTPFGSILISNLPPNAYIGFAVSSLDRTTLTTGVYTNVKVVQ